MKNLLIIYPHWPPSNLAGVHRARLVANYLPDYGWHPIVLTVHPDYYEEPHDWDLCKTVSDKIEIHQAKAYKVTKPRLIGDIGLRAFPFLYRHALRIIRERKIDFIWIPIPSFYTALLGRLLHWKAQIPYGIDYIDPWVRDISGRKDWRHILSNALARFLEPIAIKKAALITGVAEEYYMPAIARKNGKMEKWKNGSGKFAPYHLAFPYGFDPRDHEIELENIDLPWKDIPGCKPLVYAGAFLPNSRMFVESLFKSIRELMDEGRWDERVHLFFLGTGPYPGKSIVDYAMEYRVDGVVHETRSRYPFLHILNFLSQSHGVMVIGSTEKHYTASKIYQAILSKRPVFAILHCESTAYRVLKEIKADRYLVAWNERLESGSFSKELRTNILKVLAIAEAWEPDYPLLNTRYSTEFFTQKLVHKIESLI